MILAKLSIKSNHRKEFYHGHKPKTTADDIEDWDSLEHITLISAVEREFRMKFKMGEISSMKNVGEMASIIAARAKG